MDTPDITNYIIMDICIKTGISWLEAEALVKQVQVEHEQDVTKR